jgi:aminoglycoside phosphotransferase (APT) family kinase protein
MKLIAEGRGLQDWLSQKVGDDILVQDIRSYPGGAANRLLELSTSRGEWLIKYPPGKGLENLSRVRRESQVLRALGGTSVPHPRLIGWTADPKVLGTPFLIMQRLDGFTAQRPLPMVPESEPAAARTIARKLIGGLVRIGSVEWEEIGLLDFGRPDGYLERQIDRAHRQIEVHACRQRDDLDLIHRWLRSNLPSSTKVGLVHGDYHCGNAIFALRTEPDLVGIIDWELSTIGDVVADLGWFLALWEESGEETIRVGSQISALPGMPSRADLVELYATRTGLPVEGVMFYEVLALYKLISIWEIVYLRRLDDVEADLAECAYEWIVPAAIRRALSFLDRSLT